jgi:hypothetical protein
MVGVAAVASYRGALKPNTWPRFLNQMQCDDCFLGIHDAQSGCSRWWFDGDHGWVSQRQSNQQTSESFVGLGYLVPPLNIPS